MMRGEDQYGNKYDSIEEMWAREVGGIKPPAGMTEAEEKTFEKMHLVGDQSNWYNKQVKYWDVIIFCSFQGTRSYNKWSARRLWDNP